MRQLLFPMNGWRKIASFAAIPFVVILYFNIENLASRLGWGDLLADAVAPKAGRGGVVNILQDPVSLWIALLGVGFLSGMWVDYALSKRTRRKVAASIPDKVPDIRFLLQGGNIYTSSNDSKPLTGLCLDVKIWNLGGPSFPVTWQLFIRAPGMERTGAHFSKMPEKLYPAGSNSNVILYSRDEIENKMIEGQVPNRPTNGWVLFYAELDQSLISEAETIIDLTMIDQRERHFSCTQRMGDWFTK